MSCRNYGGLMNVLNPRTCIVVFFCVFFSVLPNAFANKLLNADFTASFNPIKKGAAAIGTTNDVWNIYGRDTDSESHWNWRENGDVSNLVWADGTASPIDLQVVNAPGAWLTDSADAML